VGLGSTAVLGENFRLGGTVLSLYSHIRVWSEEASSSASYRMLPRTVWRPSRYRTDVISVRYCLWYLIQFSIGIWWLISLAVWSRGMIPKFRLIKLRSISAQAIVSGFQFFI